MIKSPQMNSDPRITPQSKLDAHIHYLVALIGGFLGTYSVYTAAEAFGSAQTMNLMEMVHAGVAGKWMLAFWLALGAVCYAAGVFLATMISSRTKWNVKLLSMAVDMAMGAGLQFMPEGLPPIVYAYPAFFAMSFQYCCFSGSYGFSAATIFNSNNFRQMVSALTEWLVNGKKEFKLKFQFYGAVILSFYSASAIAFWLFLRFGAWIFSFVVIPAGFAVILILKRGRMNEASDK